MHTGDAASPAAHPPPPALTSPSWIMPRHTEYCRMPTKPRVPSMGSSTQCRPWGPPGEPPRSGGRREGEGEEPGMAVLSVWDSVDGCGSSD